jgi:hypothetical protein
LLLEAVDRYPESEDRTTELLADLLQTDPAARTEFFDVAHAPPEVAVGASVVTQRVSLIVTTITLTASRGRAESVAAVSRRVSGVRRTWENPRYGRFPIGALMPGKKAKLPAIGVIQGWQNDVRHATNFLPPGENNRRQGIAPGKMQQLGVGSFPVEHRKHIRIKKKQSLSGDEFEYVVRYKTEYLFRLVYVPWAEVPPGAGGRWHVRRHPQATWWHD